MNLKRNRGPYWPTHEQELLLQASLLQGQDALDAWHQWRASVDIECLDSESHHLLGLLYRNLSIHEVKDSHMAKLKGIYRSMWYKNQLILQKIIAIMHSFHDAGIKILVLKDAAIISRYYQDYSLRPICALDFLTRPVDAEATMNLLEKLGWIPEIKRPNKLVSLSPTLRFRSKSTIQPLILHGHIFWSGLQKNDNNALWSGAISTQIGDSSLGILSPTEQLLHVCSYGFRWHSVPQTCCIADAMMIINSSAVEIDWNRLVTQAQQYRLVSPLKNMLMLLHERLDVTIPLSILQNIQNMPVSYLERLEDSVFNKRPRPVVVSFVIRTLQHLKLIKNAGLGFNFLGFTR